MSTQDKEAILKEITKLPEPDLNFILGWCTAKLQQPA